MIDINLFKVPQFMISLAYFGNDLDSRNLNDP